MNRCTTKAKHAWQCPNDAPDGFATCDKCRANRKACKDRIRARERAQRSKFVAEHASGVCPVVQPSDGMRAPAIVLGRRYGLSTPHTRINSKYVSATCHACGNDYKCRRERILRGQAALFGCGCAGNDLHKRRNFAPIPREIIPTRRSA